MHFSGKMDGNEIETKRESLRCLFHVRLISEENEIERDMIEREREKPSSFSFKVFLRRREDKKGRGMERLIGCETANIRAQDCIYNGGKRGKTCSSGRLI